MEINKYIIASKISYLIEAKDQEEAEKIANAYNILLSSVLKSSLVTFIRKPITIESIGAVKYNK